MNTPINTLANETSALLRKGWNFRDATATVFQEHGIKNREDRVSMRTAIGRNLAKRPRRTHRHGESASPEKTAPTSVFKQGLLWENTQPH